MKEYSVEGYEPSLLPKNKNFKLVWSDEFDGKFVDDAFVVDYVRVFDEI